MFLSSDRTASTQGTGQTDAAALQAPANQQDRHRTGGPEEEARPARPFQSAKNTALQRPGNSIHSESAPGSYTGISSGPQDTNGESAAHADTR